MICYPWGDVDGKTHAHIERERDLSCDAPGDQQAGDIPGNEISGDRDTEPSTVALINTIGIYRMN